MSLEGYGYCLLSTPIGWVGVVASEKRVIEVVIGSSHDDLSGVIRCKYPMALRDDEGMAAKACLQLDEYFRGTRRNFDLNVDLSGRTNFAVSILQHLARVPFGEILTYGELASRAGFPGRARAVGQVMATNRHPLILPCHRVIGSGGRLTGYSGGNGIKTKQWLLNFENNALMKII